MRVIVGCEFSQVVTQAFRAKGHEAYSCDVLPTEGNPDWHIQGDLLEILSNDWDMGIFHPPCTYLASSGARWWKDRRQEQVEALQFVRALLGAPIERIALENPIWYDTWRLIHRPTKRILPCSMAGAASAFS